MRGEKSIFSKKWFLLLVVFLSLVFIGVILELFVLDFEVLLFLGWMKFKLLLNFVIFRIILAVVCFLLLIVIYYFGVKAYFDHKDAVEDKEARELRKMALVEKFSSDIAPYVKHERFSKAMLLFNRYLRMFNDLGEVEGKNQIMHKILVLESEIKGKRDEYLNFQSGIIQAVYMDLFKLVDLKRKDKVFEYLDSVIHHNKELSTWDLAVLENVAVLFKNKRYLLGLDYLLYAGTKIRYPASEHLVDLIGPMHLVIKKIPNSDILYEAIEKTVMDSEFDKTLILMDKVVTVATFEMNRGSLFYLLDWFSIVREKILILQRKGE